MSSSQKMKCFSPHAQSLKPFGRCFRLVVTKMTFVKHKTVSCFAKAAQSMQVEACLFQCNSINTAFFVLCLYRFVWNSLAEPLYVLKGIRQVSKKVVPLHNAFMTLLCNYLCDMEYFFDVVSVSPDR